MIGMACQFHPDRFAIINSPLSAWLRRAIPDSHKRVRDKLFLYYAVQEGNYVIGQWLHKPRGYFFDVMNLGPWMQFTRDDALHLRRMLIQPMSRAELARRTRDEMREQTLRLQDKEREFGENMAWRHSRAFNEKVRVSFA